MPVVDLARRRNYTYSPSISASSTPPSPLRALPPIHELNATTANVTGVSGDLWRYRESKLSTGVKRPYNLAPPTYYADSPSASSSPRSLPPLLPHVFGPTYSHQTQGSPGPPYPSPPPGASRNKNAWKDHAQLVKLPNGQTDWRCHWRVGDSGDATDFCGYTAKRHLVKRHIETRHLQFK